MARQEGAPKSPQEPPKSGGEDHAKRTVIPRFSSVRSSRFRKIRPCAPRIKIHHSGPSGVRYINPDASSTRIALYTRRSKRCECVEAVLHHNVSAKKEKKNSKNTRILFYGGGRSIFREFSLRFLKPKPREKRGMALLLKSSQRKGCRKELGV